MEHEVQNTQQPLQSPDTGVPEQRRCRSLRTFVIGFFVGVPAVLFWFTTIIAMVGIVAYMSETTETCTVARVQVQGVLVATDNGLGQLMNFGAITSADSVIDEITRAEEDDSIQAILIDVDSPGGTPVAGDEILTAIEHVSKPTVAVIRDQGTSAAYWAIVSADHIIASPVSDVGSIGVTMSYLELAGSSEYAGTRWVDISSGEFKDAGNPERPLSEEEESHFQGQVDAVHEYMLERLVAKRTALTREQFEEIADGRAFLGSEALALRLVDELGGITEAIAYLAQQLGVLENEVIVCPPTDGGLDELFY